MTVAELIPALSLTEFIVPDPDRPVTGGYAGDLLSWVMGRAQEGDAWVTIMSNRNVAAVALMSDVSCVILSEGVVPDDAFKTAARDEGINLLGAELSTFELAHRIHEAIGNP